LEAAAGASHAGKARSSSVDQATLQSSLMIERSLSGALPCGRCKYDLRGLSITAACPECGAPVRATLVQVIDPSASEVVALRNPKIASWSVLLWALFAATATLCVMIAHVLAWVGVGSGTFVLRMQSWAGWVGVVSAVLSGIASIGMWKPLTTDRWSLRTLLPVLGTAAYVPVVGLVYLLLVQKSGWAFLRNEWFEHRALLAIGVVVVLLCVRPVVRLLAARSWMLASTPKDRQTTFSLAVVVAAGAVVQLALWISPFMSDALLARMLSLTLALLTMLLLFLGLVRLTLDLARMRSRIEQGLSPTQTIVPRPTAAHSTT
jgi:hypothetical protein